MIAPTIIIITVFAGANIFLAWFLYRFFEKPSGTDDSVKISVVIAAKNEEKNILQLINSLTQLDYPKENFEVIVVDDNSDDKTYEKAVSAISVLSNFRIMKAAGKKYPAKKGALQFGIEKAANPYIVITDADCVPSPNWLKAFAGKFAEGNDFVTGPVIFYEGNKLINKISAFERYRNTMLTFALAETKSHYTASGGSFGYTRSSFETLKGYSSTLATFSGDDDLLLHEAIRNKMKIGMINDKGAFVYTHSRDSFKEYFMQKSRHVKASFHYLFSRQLLLSSWHLLNLVFLFSPVMMFINSWFILPVIIKIFFDLFISISFQKKLDYKFGLFEIIYLQVLYEVLLVINFINAMFRKDKWK